MDIRKGEAPGVGATILSSVDKFIIDAASGTLTGEATGYTLPTVEIINLRTAHEKLDAHIERLDHRIDVLQAEIVRLTDIIQVMRLSLEGR
jgi:hypothetical protein